MNVLIAEILILAYHARVLKTNSTEIFMSKHTIMLSGYGVPDEEIGAEEYSALINYYREKPGYSVEGDKDNGFVAENVHGLARRVRVDISAHGQIAESEHLAIYDLRRAHALRHQLLIQQDKWVDTATVITAIVTNNSETTFEFHLWSCYAGSSVSSFDSKTFSNTIEVLPPGSVLLAHGPVIIDAWSVNLYKAQLASLQKRDELINRDITEQNTVFINLPQDAIECLSIGVKDRKGGVHQFNLRTIPVTLDTGVITEYLKNWVQQIEQHLARTEFIGVKFKFSLECADNEVLKEFMRTMLVTSIRSSPQEFLVKIMQSGEARNSLALLLPSDLEDIQETTFSAQQETDKAIHDIFSDDSIVVTDDHRITFPRNWPDKHSETIQSWQDEVVPEETNSRMNGTHDDLTAMGEIEDSNL